MSTGLVSTPGAQAGWMRLSLRFCSHTSWGQILPSPVTGCVARASVSPSVREDKQ